MSIQQENRFQAIISHAKEYGFVFPSSEIYDGLSAVYDYGPLWQRIKKNISVITGGKV
jgi:glycyl-tRNA synthetase